MNVELIRYSEHDHYELIASWWKERGFHAPQPGMLNRAHGFIASINGAYTAALWLFPVSGSDFALQGWPIADPNSDRNQRHEALSALYDKIEQEAKQLGYSQLWTYADKQIIEDRMYGKGYVAGDRNVNQCIKLLGD